MENIDKLFGSEIVDILVNLQQEHTFVKMYVKGVEHEWIVVVEGVRTLFGVSSFFVSCSKDFLDVVAENQSMKIFFEFLKNNIKYSFNGAINKINGNKVWFRAPEFIEKYQRRLDFRIDTPSDAILSFGGDFKKTELEVYNVSLGGFLACEAKPFKTGLCFELGKVITDINFLLPAVDEEIENIKIKRIEIIRVKRIKKKCYYGIKIVKISSMEEKKLVKIILSLQRYDLRKKMI